MRLDPLSVPHWGDKPSIKNRLSPKSFSSGNTPQTLPTKEETRVISKREEMALEAEKTKHRITVHVVGVGGSGKNGTYTMPYEPDLRIVGYLEKLNLVKIASQNRVYDLTYPDLGRRRLNYVPQADSILQIGNKNYSPTANLQRKAVDASEVMARMGSAAKEVEYSMVYKTTVHVSPVKKDGVDDVDVDPF